ncbi:MAG: UbiD family decarboxylase, partial [Rhodospirillales bacterium]|nr:UbiD family decarboxylase [Rhodospirillales bacterium]
MADQLTNQTQLSNVEKWVEILEKHGELKRITAEVNTDLESSTFAYLSGKEIGSPALMFENLKGHEGHRGLYNMLGSSLKRICLAINEEPTEDHVEVVKILKNKMNEKLAPAAVGEDEAVVNQNIENGEDVDITKFPAPRMWPLDGGKYLGTCDAVITKDPESGRINLGTYRQMIKGKNEVGFYVSPGKDALLDREKWWAMGKPAPVAAVYGIDPLLFIVAA